MKIETREITVTKDVYIADDGTVFHNKYDCESYEYGLIEKTIEFYDQNLNKCDFDSCTYVKLVTEKDVENLIRMCEYSGCFITGIDSPGLYMFDDRSDGWIDLTNVLSTIYGGVTQ